MNTRKDLLMLGLLCLISPAAAATDTTTDINIVWVLTGIAIVFFIIGLATWGLNGVDMVSVGTMSIPIVICFKISNLFIDGTLTTTERFLSSTDVVVVSSEVIRNSAVSQLFMLIGIIISLFVCLQLYQRIFTGEEIQEM